MRRPFPTTPERKRELHAAIMREGGQPLLDTVAEFRKAFPGATLKSIKVGTLDVGDPTPRNEEVFTHDHPAMKWLRFTAAKDAAAKKKR